MGALIDRVENGEASMAHWKGKNGAQDLGDGFTLLEAKQSGDKIFIDSIFEGWNNLKCGSQAVERWKWTHLC